MILGGILISRKRKTIYEKTNPLIDGLVCLTRSSVLNCFISFLVLNLIKLPQKTQVTHGELEAFRDPGGSHKHNKVQITAVHSPAQCEILIRCALFPLTGHVMVMRHHGWR